MDGIRAGDPDAWDLLYRRMYRPLLGYARRRLGSLSVAEDAVSETMERAVVNISRFEPEGERALRRWLFGILRNVVHEQWRASRRSIDLVDRLPEPVADDGPADAALGREESARMRAAFGELTDDEQEVLELRLVEEFSAAEVGEIQGRGAGAVRMAQSRALGRLRELLGVSTDGN